MKFTGRVRVYFNRHTSDGLVWCVAGAHFEIAVRRVELHGATMATHYEPPAMLDGRRDSDNGPPSAWLEGDALVEITDDGRAILTASR